MRRNSGYAPEVRERAVRLVLENRGDHRSEWATICSVADGLGCTPESVRRWLRQAEADQGLGSGLSLDERAELRIAAIKLLRDFIVVVPFRCRPKIERISDLQDIPSGRSLSTLRRRRGRWFNPLRQSARQEPELLRAVPEPPRPPQP